VHAHHCNRITGWNRQQSGRDRHQPGGWNVHHQHWVFNQRRITNGQHHYDGEPECVHNFTVSADRSNSDGDDFTWHGFTRHRFTEHVVTWHPRHD
jgi:hypothetical protein